MLAALVCGAESAVHAQSIFDIGMPSVDSPSLGTEFYTPSSTTNRSYYGMHRQNVSSETKSDSQKKSSSEMNVTSDKKAAEKVSSLSATDVQSLGSMGLLSNLTSMFTDRDSSYTVPANMYATNSSEETDKLLKKVLNAMEELKETTAKSASSAQAVQVSAPQEEVSNEKSVSPVPAQQKAESATTKRSHILRFTVNGYNILQTCRTVYISDIQDDGTFLVTGDRKYMSDGKPRTETFHMLFRTKCDSPSYDSYEEAASVTQDSYNPNSFLYQLSLRKNMKASRVGNLVSMRTDDSDWKLELLIDLGNAK